MDGEKTLSVFRKKYIILRISDIIFKVIKGNTETSSRRSNYPSLNTMTARECCTEPVWATALNSTILSYVPEGKEAKILAA